MGYNNDSNVFEVALKTDRKYFRLIDVSVLILIISISVFSILIQFKHSENLLCIIRHDGETVDSFILSDLGDEGLVREYDYEEDIKVKFEKDGVFVISSTCGDKICVKTGRIRNAGQSIVCLPSRFSVSLESMGGSDKDIDTVVG